MSLPNILTLLRFVIAAGMLYCILAQSLWLNITALPLFILAAVTDYWDGNLARKRNQITLFGSLMDPIADKALTLSAFYGFWILGFLPGLWVAVIALRDALVTVYRMTKLHAAHVVSARSSGKNKTFLQMIYIALVLAYVGMRKAPFWDHHWNEPVLVVIRGGMMGILALTLWSGLRVVAASAPRARVDSKL